MIESKDIPSELINIRHAWIKAINRIAEAIAYCFKLDNTDQYSGMSGQQTVIESLEA